MDYSFELNNKVDDSVLFDKKFNKETVKIYSELCQGKDTSKHGKHTDVVVSYVKNLGSRIAAGDGKAKAELNALRKYAVEPLLEKEIQLLGVYGSFEKLGFNESIEVETYNYIGEKSREQAANADVVFPAIKKEKYPVGTRTVSGGWVTDYRKLIAGDMSVENKGMEQVRTSIMNKAKRLIVENAVNSIKNAKGVKYKFEGAGLTKTGVDKVLADVRRNGTGVSVIGDYALLQEFTPWAGYNSEFAYGSGSSTRYGYTNGIAGQDLADLRANGILAMYNGATLVNVDNPYDYTTLTSDGTNFETVLDKGIALVVPTGVDSPIKTWTRGGLTTFSGNDVTTANILTRFDLEIATDVTKGREFQIGIIEDTNL